MCAPCWSYRHQPASKYHFKKTRSKLHKKPETAAVLLPLERTVATELNLPLHDPDRHCCRDSVHCMSTRRKERHNAELKQDWHFREIKRHYYIRRNRKSCEIKKQAFPWLFNEQIFSKECRHAKSVCHSLWSHLNMTPLAQPYEVRISNMLTVGLLVQPILS